MRRLIFIIMLISFYFAKAQIDTTNWYPLHIGDKWEYYGQGFVYTQVEIIVDIYWPRITKGLGISIYDLTTQVGAVINGKSYDTLVRVKENEELVKEFRLFQNYLNPFNPSTTIEYTIPKAEHVSLKVFDILGKEIVILEDKYKEVGTYNYILKIENRITKRSLYLFIKSRNLQFC